MSPSLLAVLASLVVPTIGAATLIGLGYEATRSWPFRYAFVAFVSTLIGCAAADHLWPHEHAPLMAWKIWAAACVVAIGFLPTCAAIWFVDRTRGPAAMAKLRTEVDKTPWHVRVSRAMVAFFICALPMAFLCAALLPRFRYGI